MVAVAVIETPSLGDRSYVAHAGGSAVVVDPQRDLDRVEEVLAEHGLAVALVVETHVHNDYVSGGLELARRTGARYVVSADDDVAFDRTAVRDGDVLDAGGLTVRVVATPGHTDSHLAYVVTGGGADEPPAVFTGGSLLFGTVGRTDLVDPDRTDELTARSTARPAASPTSSTTRRGCSRPTGSAASARRRPPRGRPRARSPTSARATSPSPSTTRTTS